MDKFSQPVLVDPEAVSEAGIECHVIVLGSSPVLKRVFEDLSAYTFKEMHLDPHLDPADYDVVIRYENGSQDVMDEEEEFGANRLTKCQSVCITERGSQQTHGPQNTNLGINFNNN
ncbi:uncharacterized protein LOC131950130 [Physella acuta]|uniref:uncharacterized protein LOC131950130 n=1 Tax=Physella acuta TaxID=109671 RepID=UPI0027DD56A3|nr:uncharacterized protein LOC131950130 [Physella acuta]